jgi:mannose-6-phosphate isomerase
MTAIWRLKPFVRHMPWGGSTLADEFGLLPKGGKHVGEILDASCLADMPSTVDGGEDDGRPLHLVFADRKAAILGESAQMHGEEFPFLVKRIDAGQFLSVQVHPDDEQARRIAGLPHGKSEAWIVLHAAPGAFLYHGFKAGVTRAAAVQAVKEGKIVELLREMPVAEGDVVPVPPGCVHSIGKGVVVFEAQQSIDVTYRLYDWDRRDEKTGEPRKLHVAEGLEVVRPELRPEKCEPTDLEERAGFRRRRMVAMPHFEMQEWTVNGRARLAVDRVHVLQGQEGRIEVRAGRSKPSTLERGDTVLVGASAGEIEITSGGGRLLAVLPAR